MHRNSILTTIFMSLNEISCREKVDVLMAVIKLLTQWSQKYRVLWAISKKNTRLQHFLKQKCTFYYVYMQNGTCQTACFDIYIYTKLHIKKLNIKQLRRFDQVKFFYAKCIKICIAKNVHFTEWASFWLSKCLLVIWKTASLHNWVLLKYAKISFVKVCAFSK